MKKRQRAAVSLLLSACPQVGLKIEQERVNLTGIPVLKL